MKIQELICKYKEEGYKVREIAKILGISQPMVTQYASGYNASLTVARKVYKDLNIILYPFSKEGVSDVD